MKNEVKFLAVLTAVLFVAFALFTVLVKTVGAAPIGPNATVVGFSAIRSGKTKRFTRSRRRSVIWRSQSPEGSAFSGSGS